MHRRPAAVESVCLGCARIGVREASGMVLHIDALVQGTTTGVVGAGVLGLLSLCRNLVRDRWLKRSIRRNLNRRSVGSSLEGITTSVENQTGREMIVRQVAFLINGTYIVLLPSGELKSSYEGRTRKPTRAEIRRLKKGEMIQMEAEMQFRSWRVPPSPAGFVTLPPYTESGFVLPAQFIADNEGPITSIRVVLEYTTRSGERKILQHDLESKYPEHIRSTLDHFREELRNGSLNNARRMFRMPEIVVKPKPESESVT